MCIQTGKTLQDENRMRMNTRRALRQERGGNARRSSPTSRTRIENTAKIAAALPGGVRLFGTTHLPAFPLPEGETTRSAMLRRLCEEGLSPTATAPTAKDARERMEYELGVIARMGYVDYFLIVWDFIHYAKTPRHRASAPGAAAARAASWPTALGITDAGSAEVQPAVRALPEPGAHHPCPISTCDF